MMKNLFIAAVTLSCAAALATETAKTTTTTTATGTATTTTEVAKAKKPKKPKKPADQPAAQAAPAAVEPAAATHSSASSHVAAADASSRASVAAPAAAASGKSPYSAAVDMSFSKIDQGQATRNGSSTQITPRLNRKFSNFDAHATVPFTYSEVSEARTTNGVTTDRSIGRPEVGVSRVLSSNDEMTVSGNFDVRLPFYDSSLGESEYGRTFKFTPSVSADYRLGNTVNHLVGSVGASYNTKATRTDYSIGTSREFGYESPFAVSARAGIVRKMERASLGVAVSTLNELGSARITVDNSVFAQASPLDLAAGEIFGSYDVRNDVSLNASLKKGFKSAYAPNNFSLGESNMGADTTLTIGAAKAF